MTAHTDDRRTGLKHKYDVKRVNDPDGKHDDCGFFVLDPKHDALAAPALRAYADVADRAGYHRLAADLREWLRRLDYCPNCSQVRGHRGACG